MPYVNHLYYEETGAGRPVIFIHCPALSHIYWRPIMERLAPISRCIAIDIRGHGRSGLGDRPWHFTDIARDVAMLTRELDLQDPVLVGYSSGGSIALTAVLEEPALYSGVVAVSSFSECCTTSMMLKVRLGLIAASLGLLPYVGTNILSTNSTGKEHAKAMLPDARQVRPVSFRSFLMETLRNNFTHRLHGVRVPALLVNGADDEWMHPYYRLLRERLPNARAVFFPGVDHRVPTRQPELFADALAEFLAGLEEDPTIEVPFLPTYEHPGAEQHQFH